MAIDKKPAVGRIIIRDSYFRNGYFGESGEIIKISGSRIYYKRFNRFKEEMVEEYCRSFAAICDTQDELQRCRAFSKKAREESQALQDKLDTEFRFLFDEN